LALKDQINWIDGLINAVKSKKIENMRFLKIRAIPTPEEVV